MSNVRIVSFGVDEDARPELWNEETCISNFQDWFWSGVPAQNKDIFVNYIQTSEERNEYIFCKEEMNLDDLLEGMKKECEFEEWDQEGEQSKQFIKLSQQFKDQLKDKKKYTLYSWALEYDKNILAIIED